jgi:plastocyanin
MSHQVFAQLSLLPSQKETLPTYLIRIVPGAADKNNTLHYYPQNIAIPTGTTVAWFNDDPSQPHTVTSGPPGSPDSGKQFNSGLIPYTSFTQYTFDGSGNFLYHCLIHPWRTGSVYVSSAYEQGHNFKFSTGSDIVSNGTHSLWTFNTTQNDRTLMKIEPTTVTVEETTPLTYNFTILNSEMENVFSKNFFSLGPNLQIELIKSDTNKTTVYGPDFSDPITGAYHIQGNFPNGDYSLVVQLVAVGSEMPKVDAIDEFRGRIIS